MKNKVKKLDIFSETEKQKLINHFTSMYGEDYIAREKANSFAVGFDKAWELLEKRYKQLHPTL